jgi:hypothetical protein
MYGKRCVSVEEFIADSNKQSAIREKFYFIIKEFRPVFWLVKSLSPHAAITMQA